MLQRRERGIPRVRDRVSRVLRPNIRAAVAVAHVRVRRGGDVARVSHRDDFQKTPRRGSGGGVFARVIRRDIHPADAVRRAGVEGVDRELPRPRRVRGRDGRRRASAGGGDAVDVDELRVRFHRKGSVHGRRGRAPRDHRARGVLLAPLRRDRLRARRAVRREREAVGGRDVHVPEAVLARRRVVRRRRRRRRHRRGRRARDGGPVHGRPGRGPPGRRSHRGGGRERRRGGRRCERERERGARGGAAAAAAARAHGQTRRRRRQRRARADARDDGRTRRRPGQKPTAETVAVVVRGAVRVRCVLYTGPHTTPFARWTPILKDSRRRISPPTPRFQSPSSTPFNSV